MSQKITLNNIKEFIEGNTRMLLSERGKQPQHLQEQYAYRILQCQNDCAIKKECKYCGCSFPGKIYVSKSCNNGERFPDLMNAKEWEEFKKENKIE